jgi:CRP-like cAMP-binding protein
MSVSENDLHLTPIRNRILSTLPPDEFQLLLPHLEEDSVPVGTILADYRDSLKELFFPNNGMISLLSVNENGCACEVGYIGFEGLLCISPLIGKNELPYQALVQTTSSGYHIPVAVAKEVFDRGGAFHDAVLRFSYVVVRQTAQTCACNQFHPIRARLCRWFTVMCERSGNKHLSITQEFLAHMLGVQRTSIGPIAAGLQNEGIIRYRRGRVEIVDFDRLQGGACECYWIVKEEYASYLQDGVSSPMSDTRQTLPV